ncbi:MAG TPA: formate dehydrogenase accessory protein FdhE [Rhodocyclaceae bacterium]|nr:formate dehydrogenase accessory protein FdhE [Rhodocyclaceae bacterium]
MQEVLLSPEQIALRAGQQIPYLQLPDRSLAFAAREARLRQLAPSHAMHDFLLFAAALARSQQEALQGYPEVALPDAAALKAAAALGQPPLPALHWRRDDQWRTVLRALLDGLSARLDPGPAREAVRRVLEMEDAGLERQADRLLAGQTAGLDMAAAPLIAAGLQVYWTHMVLAIRDAHGAEGQAPFGRTADATCCPCCGSLPTASVSRIDPGGGHYRYLQCSLCPAQWHMVRIKCSHCEGTKGIQYQSLQAADASGPPGKAAVEAETCDQCGHYLKIVRMERNPAVEPAADDLASLTLDLLLSQAGYRRHGVNLMLLFRDPDDSGGAGG